MKFDILILSVLCFSDPALSTLFIASDPLFVSGIFRLYYLFTTLYRLSLQSSASRLYMSR